LEEWVMIEQTVCKVSHLAAQKGDLWKFEWRKQRQSNFWNKLKKNKSSYLTYFWGLHFCICFKIRFHLQQRRQNCAFEVRPFVPDNHRKVRRKHKSKTGNKLSPHSKRRNTEGNTCLNSVVWLEFFKSFPKWAKSHAKMRIARSLEWTQFWLQTIWNSLQRTLVIIVSH
jgi:hypothetical protein